MPMSAPYQNSHKEGFWCQARSTSSPSPKQKQVLPEFLVPMAWLQRDVQPETTSTLVTFQDEQRKSARSIELNKKFLGSDQAIEVFRKSRKCEPKTPTSKNSSKKEIVHKISNEAYSRRALNPSFAPNEPARSPKLNSRTQYISEQDGISSSQSTFTSKKIPELIQIFNSDSLPAEQSSQIRLGSSRWHPELNNDVEDSRDSTYSSFSQHELFSSKKLYSGRSRFQNAPLGASKLETPEISSQHSTVQKASRKPGTSKSSNIQSNSESARASKTRKPCKISPETHEKNPSRKFDNSSKMNLQAQIQASQDKALRSVRAAERDRQRVLRSLSPRASNTPPPKDEYNTVDKEIPPYHAQLHRYLDLISYDERFAPVLRVNRYLVHGDDELSAAITKMTNLNLLPGSTDLWAISHVDDRDYEIMIPRLIPIANFFPGDELF